MPVDNPRTPFDRLLTPNNIRDRISKLEQKQIEPDLSVDQLSEFADDLGDIAAGRFIAPLGEDGEPTSGTFSGSWMSAIGEAFPEGTIKIGAATDGVLNFGITDNGGVIANSMMFNGAELDARLTLDSFGIMTRHTGTEGSETRVMRMGLQNNGTNGEGGIEFYEPGTDVALTNAGFESGDFTGWTTGGGDTWSISSIQKNSGSYSAQVVFNNVADEPTLQTETRFAVSGQTYDFSLHMRMSNSAGPTSTSATHTATMQVKFYDAASGGSLVSTETIAVKTLTGYFAVSNWTEYSKNISVPAGATHAIFYVSLDTTYSLSGNELYAASFDDFSVTNLAANTKLTFKDDDLNYLHSTGANISLVPVKYAKGNVGSVSTSGETSMFSVDLPANFLPNSQASAEFAFTIVTTATPRTLTMRLYTNAQVVTYTYTLAASKGYTGIIAFKFLAWSSTEQTWYSDVEIWNTTDSTSLSSTKRRETTTSETQTSPITIAATLQLSGAVSYGVAHGAKVVCVEDATLW